MKVDHNIVKYSFHYLVVMSVKFALTFYKLYFCFLINYQNRIL